MSKIDIFKTCAVVLAAGKGKRMKSKTPKVLHKILGKPIVSYILKTLKKLNLKTVVVVGHKASEVMRVLGKSYIYAVQKQQLGTGHALKTALRVVPPDIETILVVNGDDSAFLRPQTLRKFIEFHNQNHGEVSLLYSSREDPEGLGRIKRDTGRITKIVEEKDATLREKKIKEINTGIYCFRSKFLREKLKNLSKSKVSGEYYLTDLVEIAARDLQVYGMKLKDPSEWFGINTPYQLEQANKLMKRYVKKL